MKLRILYILLFLPLIINAQNTELWGLSYGGKTRGTIFKLDKNRNFEHVRGFETIVGRNPQYTNMVLGTDGLFYGMTKAGGVNDYGIIFSYDSSRGIYTKLYDFDGLNGYNPHGSLVLGTDGLFYGMTCYGGRFGVGVIFSYEPSRGIYTKLYDFNGSPARNPFGSLIQGTDGLFYGMTHTGGGSNAGVIFSYNSLNGEYTTIHSFNNADGRTPYGSLIQSSNGLLYGMTYYGGHWNAGVIFSYNISNDSFIKLHDFDNANGKHPYSELIEGIDGKLYGVTSAGGDFGFGVVFSYDSSNSSYNKLHNFDNSNGGYPYGNLIQAPDGIFYGLTTAGGASNNGVLFTYDPIEHTYVKLYDFDKTNGGKPQNSLILGDDGLFYGMTQQGGIDNFGVLFTYNSTTNIYNKIRDFYNFDSSHPYGSLLRGSDGLFYGMTSGGGDLDKGVIFSYNLINDTYSELYEFDGLNGESPFGTLIQGLDGLFYGVTFAGGNSGTGALFSYDSLNGIYTKLYDFDETSGYWPQDALIQGQDQLLYGITRLGGDLGYGVIYSYNPSDGTYTKEYNFDGLNGALTNGALIRGADGLFYGMTERGGNSDQGVIFSYDISTNIYSKLYDFEEINGAKPHSSLVLGANGLLYGMTQGGGSYSKGVVFSYNTVNGSYIKLHDFNGANGRFPQGSLFQSSDGLLYGMTQYGGTRGAGVVFSMTLSGTYSKIHDFDNDIGANPRFGSLIEVCTPIIITPDNVILDDITGICDVEQPTAPTATYNCDITVAGTPNISFPVIDKDITEIVWTYDDGNGGVVKQNQVINWKSIDNSILISGTTLSAVDQDGATYQWINCDTNQDIPQADSRVYEVMTNGSYAVKVTIDNCTVISDCKLITTLDIEENELSKLSIYPNPNSGYFMLDIGNIEPKSIILYDITGKQIIKLPNQQKQEVNLDIDNGIYVLQIKTATASKELKLLINR